MLRMQIKSALFGRLRCHNGTHGAHTLRILILHLGRPGRLMALAPPGGPLVNPWQGWVEEMDYALEVNR